MELLLLGLDACDTFVLIFIACELSQRISNSFIEFSDLIDHFHWYRFPTKVKRMLPMAMIIVQRPVSIVCFGSFSCCREAFRKVFYLKSNFHSYIL